MACQTLRSMHYLGIISFALLLAAGCAIRDPQALIDLQHARQALNRAKQTGAAERFPKEFAALEQQYQAARGTFYACQEAKASEMARALIAKADVLATKRPEAPRSAPAPAAPKPVAVNQPPRARIKAPALGDVKALLKFDGSGSRDPDGDKLTYHWDFGDGASARFTFPIATHRYTKPGLYTVRLTVDDGRGGSDTTTTTVAVQRRVVVYHQVDRYQIKRGLVNPEAFPDLDTVVREMRYDLTLRAFITAHTDATASSAYNIRLSERRAKAVRDYLTSQGISANRITLAWKGEAQPLAPNTTTAGRARNRRTEVLVRPVVQ